ncbi:MAG: response regulator transcription factor [Actinomycetota bacterium]
MLLVDDQSLTREGVEALLSRETDIEVLGGVATLADALASEHDPDVILAELVLPGCERSEVLRALRERFASAAILMLTTARTPADVYEALAEGANGYLLKDADASELVMAVRRVAEGEQHLGPEMIALLDPAPYPRGDLTPRELEVANLLVDGHLNHEIAEILHLSVRTIEHHRSNLLHKLGFHSRAELVRWVAARSAHPATEPTDVSPNPF